MPCDLQLFTVLGMPPEEEYSRHMRGTRVARLWTRKEIGQHRNNHQALGDILGSNLTLR